MELYISVAELKAHLNIAEEYADEDTQLLRLLKVSHVSVETHIRQPLTTFVDESGELNPMLGHAILIISGHFYATREPVAFVQPHPIPYTFEYLLQPFKKYT